MSILGEKVEYSKLNARQKEIYNFQKVSAIFSNYGYTTIKLSDDWMGADFIAIDPYGKKHLKVQLKTRLCFDKKYINKGIYICFDDKKFSLWYLYDHDEFLTQVRSISNIEKTMSWRNTGSYTFPSIPSKIRSLLKNQEL